MLQFYASEPKFLGVRFFLVLVLVLLLHIICILPKKLGMWSKSWGDVYVSSIKALTVLLCQ